MIQKWIMDAWSVFYHGPLSVDLITVVIYQILLYQKQQDDQKLLTKINGSVQLLITRDMYTLFTCDPLYLHNNNDKFWVKGINWNCKNLDADHVRGSLQSD
jgi:hypothetical protein